MKKRIRKNGRRKLVLFLMLLPSLMFAQLHSFSGASLVVSENIKSPIRETIITMLQEEVQKRSQLTFSVGHKFTSTTIVIALSSDPALGGKSLPSFEKAKMGDEGFSCSVEKTGGQTIIWIIGSDEKGAIYGAGYFLRLAKFEPKKIIFDSQNAITTTPQYAIRGHQLGYRNTANSWDAWNVAQFEQYIRELCIFGTNTIENIPLDKTDSPHMTVSKEDMNVQMSEMCYRYGLNYGVWIPVEVDLSDKNVSEAEEEIHRDYYSQTPHLHDVFVPGGDPGHNHPKYVLPFLERISKHLHQYHPDAGIWLSLQGFSYEQIDYFCSYLETHKPTWLRGLVSGPSSPNMAETRHRLPQQYQHRHYPDITHTVRCQYPTLNWDQAYALTLGREASNPEPHYYGDIHNQFAPLTNGFVTYSDGVHDDVNKVVWSMRGWNSQEKIEDIVDQYVSFFFGTKTDDRVSDALFALTNNWNGAIERNGGIELTLAKWQELEKKYIKLVGNWRWELLMLRSYYDTYIRRRKIYETKLEKEANQILSEANKDNVASTLDRALDQVNIADKINIAPKLQAKIIYYCDALYKSVGLQTSVEKYKASGAERGCVLDYMDYPLNNRWWLADEFDKIKKMNLPEEQLARIETIRLWETPETGSYYDNVSAQGQSPHVTTSVDDACDVAWWEKGLSRKRLSTQLFQNFPKLTYNDLDPSGRYIIRVAGYGDALLRVDGYRINPTVYNKGLEEFKEFLIDRRFVSDGKLEVSFDEPEESALNWRQQSKVCDIWLIKK